MGPSRPTVENGIENGIPGSAPDAQGHGILAGGITTTHPGGQSGPGATATHPTTSPCGSVGRSGGTDDAGPAECDDPATAQTNRTKLLGHVQNQRSHELLST